MSFKINSIGEKDNLKLRLENESNGTYVEVFALGAVLNEYAIKSGNSVFNCIDAYKDPNELKTIITERFQGAKLSPFVCRLTEGTFSFNGKQYHTGKHFDGKSAIHGLVYDELFELDHQEVTDDRASITLVRNVKADQYGFPFLYTIKIIYILKSNDIVDIETIITNEGNETMPLNDGWHPYFRLDDRIDNTLLKFRSKQMAIFNSSLLPTGEFKDYDEFAEFKTINSTELDNSFTIDALDSPALELESKSKKLKLSVYPKEGYPILQIYIPPTRNSIAVENLTSLPDSFNNKIGLLQLEPNETKHFVTSYHLQKLS
ncbi:MAG: aldose 1-epimerase [Pseudopedobacter saltans]|uniref:Aldose 1-epimerase n=1 Tax=Pseudopedobacter saltans TaxID=151895 RepID=A0A2W5F442_9SPHI|nr:MAG: aldose 1-epimerase [Pseudopedobacter saltans]